MSDQDRKDELVRCTRTALNLLDALIEDKDPEGDPEAWEEASFTDLAAMNRVRGIIHEHQRGLQGMLAHGPFTLEEDNKLVYLCPGAPTEEEIGKIAAQLNRTVKAIQLRIYILQRTKANSVEELHEMEARGEKTGRSGFGGRS